MVDPADDWDLANLEQQVSDLEYEKEEYRLLLVNARELMVEGLKYDLGSRGYQKRVRDFLTRLPR